MREIQDATLNTARGLEAVNARIAELRRDFEGRARPQGQLVVGSDGKTVLRRTGFAALLVPLSQVILPREGPAQLLSTSRRQFVLTMDAGPNTQAQLPIHGYNTRTVLRGATIYNDSPSHKYQHSVFRDGAQSCEIITIKDSTNPESLWIFDSWALGVVASALHMAKAVADLGQSPSTDFAVELHAFSQANRPQLCISSEWGNRASYMERYHLVFPRYSFVATDSIATVLNEIRHDLHSSAGFATGDKVLSVS